MVLQSTAKINLYLDITGKDPEDGYHFIDSLFQEVTLADEMKIEPADRPIDRIEFDIPGIEGESTVHKALRVFREKFGGTGHYHITVRKTIPLGAGLGGGSSNAAFLLLFLADRYKISLEDLMPAAAKVGSDVPFFLTGGLCRVSGKGEILTPVHQKLNGIHFIIVYPNIPISTKWAYSIVDNYNKHADLENILKKSELNIDFLEKIVYNKFQIFVLKRNDALLEAKKRLDYVLGSRFSFMSGSGSSLVFVYDDRCKAAKDCELLHRDYDYKAYLCDPLYR